MYPTWQLGANKRSNYRRKIPAKNEKNNEKSDHFNWRLESEHVTEEMHGFYQVTMISHLASPPLFRSIFAART